MTRFRWPLLAFCLIPSVVLSAPRVNNGGGGWACLSKNQPAKIIWVQTMDLWEAQAEGLSLRKFKGLSADSILHTLETEIQKNFHTSLPTKEFKIFREKDAEFITTDISPIDDVSLWTRPHPSTCKEGLISYVQIGNHVLDRDLVLAKEIWDNEAFSEDSRAALLLHESIYAYLRMKFGDTESTRARKIVGILFSALPIPDKETEIAIVLMTPPSKEVRKEVGTRQHLLKCFADVDKIRDSMKLWEPAFSGSSWKWTFDSYTFEVETDSLEGLPQKMAIRHRGGAVASGNFIQDTFRKSEQFGIKLEIENSPGKTQTASLNCF